MKNLKNLTLAALFLALGLVMPFLTMQIPEIGSMLLPMHIPVLMCGFVCGWKYGFAVGFITPLLRSFIFGMPSIHSACAMAFELAAYGLVAGLLYSLLKNKKFGEYISLLGAMLVGRAVWGVASFVVYKIIGDVFTWQIFFAGAVTQALPGIILQIVIIPPIIMLLNKNKLLDK